MTLVKADAYGPGLKQITVSQVAKWCDTIPWEILTRISARVPRVYLGGHAA
ncbi:MAG: alanine racemase C-terminal domain-containing protein [Verrucomicrobiia bacterium]|jgi:alanine racemase